MWSAKRARHVEQAALAGRPVVGDGRLERCPAQYISCSPSPSTAAGPLEREIGVEVAVRALGPRRSPRPREAPCAARRPGSGGQGLGAASSHL